MEPNSGPNITLRLTQPIWSCRLDKALLRRLCDLLEERVSAAAAIEIQAFAKGQQTEEAYETNKRLLAEAFRLSVTIKGVDGNELYGTVKDVFGSPNFPEHLAMFYANSSTVLGAAYNYTPRNSLEILLDFGRPDPFDFNHLPSRATENPSKFLVQGFDASWTNGLFNELSTFFRARRAHLAWIHRSSVWDALLWGLGMPFCFWVAYRLSPFIDRAFSNYSAFVEAVLYLYIFLVSANLLRSVFHYARWVWPRVEYVAPGNRALAHRITLGTLATGVVGAFLYDLLKLAFT